MAVPPAPDQRSGVTEETSPAPDTAERTTSHSLRLILLVVLSVLLLASVAAVAYLAATRPVSALGIDGDQDSLQSERESVMAQSEQFMLRINTYGPDLLEGDDHAEVPRAGRRGHHLQVRRRLREERPAGRGDGQAGRARAHRRGVQHRRLGDRLRLGHRAGGRLDHAVLPEEPRLRRAGEDRARAVPRPGHAGQGEGHLAGRRLQPAHRHRRQRHRRHSRHEPRLPSPTEGVTP